MRPCSAHGTLRDGYANYMTQDTHTHTAEEERQREERRPSPAQAAPPLSPPVDEYDLHRGREKLERVLAK